MPEKEQSESGNEGHIVFFSGSSGPLLCGKQTTFEGGEHPIALLYFTFREQRQSSNLARTTFPNLRYAHSNDRLVERPTDRKGGKKSEQPHGSPPHLCSPCWGSTTSSTCSRRGENSFLKIQKNLESKGEHCSSDAGRQRRQCRGSSRLLLPRKLALRSQDEAIQGVSCWHSFSTKYFKAHFFTWTTGEKELSRGINLCPLVSIPNVTTTDIRHRTIIPQNSPPETIIPEIDLIPN